MTFKQIASHLSINAEFMSCGIRVYLWSKEDEGASCHVFKSLDAAVAKYGDEELDEELDRCGRAVYINTDSVFFWLK